MAKIHDILGLAEYEAKEISRSPQDWMKYLDTASKLYRYSFSDTLLIHAQRPDAVACAELELWNEKMNRWVNRGAKGIALIDDSGPRRRLRYVFDISDTHPVRGGRTPYLWQIQDQHRVPLLDHLTDTYGLEGDDSADIQNALLSISADMADENLEEAIEGLEYELENSFLEGLDEDTIRVEFRNSAFYTLSRRCGLDPMEYLEEEDFFGITDFNSLSVLTFLGNATSQIVEPVLRDIGRTIRRFSMEEMQKTVANDIEMPYNKFNTLIRESEKNEGGTEHGTDISSKRGLPVPEPDHTGRTDDNREIRDASEDISEGEQEELVSEHDADRETEQPSVGDRESSRGENGDSDGRVTGEIPGSGQEDRSDGMDSTHEQSDSDGRRERAEGIGIQLTEEEPDLSEAEENIASALSLPELPSVERQIRSIEERAAALYAGEIPIPADVVDEVLRTGSNRERKNAGDENHDRHRRYSCNRIVQLPAGRCNNDQLDLYLGRTAFCNAGYWLMLETQYYSCNDHYVCIMDRKYRMDNLWTAGASGNGKFPSGISVHDCFSDPWPCSDSRAAWNKTWIFPLIQRRKSGLLGKGGKDRW